MKRFSKSLTNAFLLVSGLGLTLFLTACGGAGTGNSEASSPDEFLNDQALKILDESTPGQPTPLNEIFLNNGKSVQEILDQYGNSSNLSKSSGNNITRQPQSPDEYKYLIMARMIAEAERLAKRSNWQFPNQQPPQNGLAYVYGGKDPQRRIAAGCCPKLNGLDCSGLISMCAQNAEILVSHGASAQKEPSSWTINPSWGVTMEKLPGSSPLEKGDIVYWNTAQTGGAHIGLVQGEYIIQSNGKYVQNCDQSGAAECARNYSTKRGPNKWLINTAIQAFGKPTTVLRLKAVNAGEYYKTVQPNWSGEMGWFPEGFNYQWAYRQNSALGSLYFVNYALNPGGNEQIPFEDNKIYNMKFVQAGAKDSNGRNVEVRPPYGGLPASLDMRFRHVENNKLKVEIINNPFSSWMIGPSIFDYPNGLNQSALQAKRNAQIKSKSVFGL